MRKRMATLRFLIDRRTAGRFAELTDRMKPAQIGLHFQNVLAASISNPTAVLTRLVGDGLLDRQVSVFRPNQKPVLLELRCEDVEQRDAIRRLLTALTAELASQLAGPVIPDPSTVVRALVANCVETSVLHRSEPSARRQQGAGTGNRRTHPESVPAKPRKRRRKEGKTVRRKPIDWSKPHPDFPDVLAHAIAWRPGRRGRPPLNALRNGHGIWSPPPGWRIIRGRWHPPIDADDVSRDDVAGSGLGLATGGEVFQAVRPTPPSPPPVNVPAATPLLEGRHIVSRPESPPDSHSQDTSRQGDSHPPSGAGIAPEG